MHSRVRVIHSKTTYSGRIVQVKVDRVIEPGRVTVTREVVFHSDSVVVLPRLADGRVLLVRQFRYATRRRLWELVAGGIDPGETPRQAARRELAEESGYHARSLKPLFTFYPSPGFLTEQMHLMEARDLTRSKAHPEADERIETRLFTRSEMLTMLRAKKIQDGKTLVGLLWLLGFDYSKT